jgi:hypothetical protein
MGGQDIIERSGPAALQPPLTPTLRRLATPGLFSSLLIDIMLELTFSFDVPLEANRVSSEDT